MASQAGLGWAGLGWAKVPATPHEHRGGPIVGAAKVLRREREAPLRMLDGENNAVRAVCRHAPLSGSFPSSLLGSAYPYLLPPCLTWPSVWPPTSQSDHWWRGFLGVRIAEAAAAAAATADASVETCWHVGAGAAVLYAPAKSPITHLGLDQLRRDTASTYENRSPLFLLRPLRLCRARTLSFYCASNKLSNFACKWHPSFFPVAITIEQLRTLLAIRANARSSPAMPGNENAIQGDKQKRKDTTTAINVVINGEHTIKEGSDARARVSSGFFPKDSKPRHTFIAHPSPTHSL